MRLVFISDIHANLTALQAVLGDMPAADGIVCCGDLVEYYDQPNEVCARVRERDISCIRGNHDAYVIGSFRTHLGPNVFKAFGDEYEPILAGSAVLLTYWLILFWMYRQKFFVKI